MISSTKEEVLRDQLLRCDFRGRHAGIWSISSIASATHKLQHLILIMKVV